MKNNQSQSEVWELAWGLGFQIAIPLVIFALLGRVLDNKLNTGPWLLLLGVLIAIIVTSLLVYKKVNGIMSDLNEDMLKNKSGDNKKDNSNSIK